MRQIFVNLAVKDVKRSMEFFAALGFEFNPKFTNDAAACLIINDNAFAMLLGEAFFQAFTKRAICDTTTHTECLLAFSCDSREAVDSVVHKAIAIGGTAAMDPTDHGFMYGWSFYDLDGHHWEVGWMDPNATPPASA